MGNEKSITALGLEATTGVYSGSFQLRATKLGVATRARLPFEVTYEMGTPKERSGRVDRTLNTIDARSYPSRNIKVMTAAGAVRHLVTFELDWLVFVLGPFLIGVGVPMFFLWVDTPSLSKARKVA